MTFKKKALVLALCAAMSGTMVGCSSDDGKDGAPGADGQDGAAGQNGANGQDGTDGQDGADGQNGADGASGLNSLVSQSVLLVGDENCTQGGTEIRSGLDLDSDGMLSVDETTETSYLCNATALNNGQNFNRVASFPVCLQLDATCNVDDETAAEIVAASDDGMTLIYTDSPSEKLGFVDITDAAEPVAAGTLDLPGEPTSVAVKGDYALVAINTSTDFVNVSGSLLVVNIASQTIVRTIDLGGQPDSIAVSPDKAYAAIVIENERDEDLGDGEVPQLPAGSFISVNISDSEPDNWTINTVDMTGLAEIAPEDPEPEYVDINENNIAVVTMQENNHIALVDLPNGTVMNHFTAGTVDLSMIDATEEDSPVISLTESLTDVPREPDGVSWINSNYFATADEGDMNGGSRGFTVYNLDGDVVWGSGNTLDHLAVRLGHYPEGRSGNKGNEPENIEMGTFGSDRYLFVNSERSSLIFVYDAADPTRPLLKQILPAAAGPEGVLAIPSRNLLVAASEEDSRGDKLRSALNIYSYQYQEAAYPTLQSASRADGSPIPWAAMSGLSSDPSNSNTLYSIEDSAFGSSRIFEIDVSNSPALLKGEIRLMDSNDVFAAVSTSGATEDADSFDDVDLAAMINADKNGQHRP